MSCEISLFLRQGPPRAESLHVTLKTWMSLHPPLRNQALVFAFRGDFLPRPLKTPSPLIKKTWLPQTQPVKAYGGFSLFLQERCSMRGFYTQKQGKGLDTHPDQVTPRFSTPI